MSLEEKLTERAGRAKELERLLSDPEVTSNGQRVAKLSRELGLLRPFVEAYEEWVRLERERREAEGLAADRTVDPEMRDLADQEAREKRTQVDGAFDGLKRMLVAVDEFGDRDAIVEIRAGAGGDEAALFARDLYEMYQRLATRRDWKVEVMDGNPTEHGGLKHVVFSVSGPGVWQSLKFESGVHRVQRVPETEQAGRIHTSTATVAVLPEAEEVDVVIRPEDIQEDFMRAGGPGGQNVNKTSSAVRLTHIPSGLVVKCQDESSQRKNRDRAMRILRARLLDLKTATAAKERAQTRKAQVGTGDRSEKIRTYHFKENRLTDHRIGFTSHSLDKVLQGDLDAVLQALQDADLEAGLSNL